jgi:hypothetical protein
VCATGSADSTTHGVTIPTAIGAAAFRHQRLDADVAHRIHGCVYGGDQLSGHAHGCIGFYHGRAAKLA